MNTLYLGFTTPYKSLGKSARFSLAQKLLSVKKSLLTSYVVTNPRYTHTSDVRSRGACSLTQDGLIKSYGPLANHADLDLARLLSPPSIIEDTINHTQDELLDAALKSFLPKTDLPRPRRTTLPIGHQQVHFRPRLCQTDLLPDGTDTRFLPGSASIWQYRLWAGGSVSQLYIPHDLAQSQIMQREVVEDIRIVGSAQPERLFATIRKEIVTPVMASSEVSTDAKHSGSQQSSDDGVVERYTLCFLRQPPGAAGQAKAIKPPNGALYTHTMKPDANLLFQFSALTHNAHKIHLDPTYAREVYKLKGPVVHGPLMMILMLDFLQITLAGLGGPRLICEHMDYRNFAPLYVDEEFRLCCKPNKVEEEGQALSQATEWQVWIQTGSEGSASLAVRGTVRVGKMPVND